jgi:hypothetical protein
MLPRYLIAGVLLLGVAAGSAGYFYRRQHSPAPVEPSHAPITPVRLAPPPPPPQLSAARDSIGQSADKADDAHRRELQARAAAQAAQAPAVKIAHVGDDDIVLSFKLYHDPPSDPNAFVDDNKGGGFFAPLAADAAAGNISAARHLYEALQMCRAVPLTPKDQEAQRQQIRDAFSASGGGNSGNRLEDNLAIAQQHYDRCAGVEQPMFGEALGYLRAAADRGNGPATLEYAYAILKDDPAEARQRFEVLWEKGHVAALAGLAQTVKDSLPYRIAYGSQHIAQFDPPESPVAERVIESARALQDQLRNETSPSEYNVAAKKAAALLRNPTCCLVP